MRLLCFTMLTIKNASSRVLCYQFGGYLTSHGIEVRFCPPSSVRQQEFFLEQAKKYFRGQNWLLSKIYWYLIVLPNRLRDILRVPFYDVVFIQRRMFDYASPPIFERIVTLLHKKTIYNFDDAIYLRLPKHMARRVRWARWVVTGNENLAEFARRYNPTVRVIESCVDTDNYYRAKSDYAAHRPVVIGWTGTPYSFCDLPILEEALDSIAKKYDIVFRVISSKPYSFNKTNIRAEFVRWQLEREVENLLGFDVGVMPLADNEYNRAKEGYKIKQYMACGLPVVCSPVGKNRELVEDDVTGFWACSKEEWIEKLSMLIESEALRGRLGKAGRAFIEQHYSLRVIAPQLKQLIEDVYND
jgi:glycosyltransferase involved in cell wall biosynthesis